MKKLGNKLRVSMKKINQKVKIASVVLTTIVVTNLFPLIALAQDIDVSTITKPFTIIKTIIYVVVGGIGGIVLILGVVDLMTSIGSHDIGGLKAGGFKMASGIILVSIVSIMALMGI